MIEIAARWMAIVIALWRLDSAKIRPHPPLDSSSSTLNLWGSMSSYVTARIQRGGISNAIKGNKLKMTVSRGGCRTRKMRDTQGPSDVISASGFCGLRFEEPPLVFKSHHGRTASNRSASTLLRCSILAPSGYSACSNVWLLTILYLETATMGRTERSQGSDLVYLKSPMWDNRYSS
jgi:hypothetical protein